MKRLNYLFKTLVLVMFTSLLYSCSTVRGGIKDIQLGMDREQVVSRLGKSFTVVSLVQTQEGGLETLRYKDETVLDGFTGYYHLSFLNGRLVEMFREDANSRPGPPPPVAYPHDRR